MQSQSYWQNRGTSIPSQTLRDKHKMYWRSSCEVFAEINWYYRSLRNWCTKRKCFKAEAHSGKQSQLLTQCCAAWSPKLEVSQGLRAESTFRYRSVGLLVSNIKSESLGVLLPRCVCWHVLWTILVGKNRKNQSSRRWRTMWRFWVLLI